MIPHLSIEIVDKICHRRTKGLMVIILPTLPYTTYQNGYWLTRDGMKWFWSNYLTNQTNLKDPSVSPLQASIGQLKGLPPAERTMYYAMREKHMP